VVGTPGGSTIITSVFQTIVNILHFDMTAFDAVAAPRFHHQWLPDSIQIEKDCFSAQTISKLESMGHKFKKRSSIGKVEAILITAEGKLHGGADIRKDDDAKGF
jgi:gamma-glutamyltranspeptidase/glutathione hydrolase